MILNQFLPLTELQSILSKDQLHSLDFILDTLDPSKKIPLLEDRETLGRIYHSTKIDQYKNAEMRVRLLVHAPPDIRKKYFLMCNFPDHSGMNDDQVYDKIKKVCKFDWGNNDETKKFVQCFDYPEYLIPDNSTIDLTEEIIDNKKLSESLEPFKLLLEYQAKIVYKALKNLQILNARFLIQMPTGSGKTRTAMDILAHYFNKNNEHQVVWLAHSSELLSQAVDSFKHVWQHTGKFPITIYRIWGNEVIPQINDKNSIIFAGYEKLKNHINKQNRIKPDLIVIDEAHKVLAPKYNDLLKKLSTFEKNTRIFGLTATPGRGIDETQNKLLVEEFHNNLIGIELDSDDAEKYEENIIDYLEEQEILAKAELCPLKTNYEYTLTNDEWNNLAKKLHDGDYREFDPQMLKTLAEDNKRNILIIDSLKKYAIAGNKILYFSTDLDQSILVTAALTKLGIKAIHVDGDTDKKFRKEIIKKFKNSDEVNVICNFNIFSTGFDVSNLNVVFISRPINSPVLFNQIVGRGTRGIKMGGKKSFNLVQVIDKISAEYEFEPYRHYARWEHNWRNNES